MCPEQSGLISICILWNIIYGAVKSNEGAWSERWRLSSGKAASSSLGVLGAEGDLEAAFSQFKGRHSEDCTFSFQSRCRQDCCPMFPSQAVMLLDCYRRGAAVRLLHAELVSKPQLPVPGSSCGCSRALGWVPAPCWAVQSGWERFCHLCAFPASPARSRAGQPLPRALCSAGCVHSGVVRDSFELLLSYLAPKPQPRSQTRCSPRLSPPWSLRGKAGAAGCPQKGCRGGRERGRILPFSFHG